MITDGTESAVVPARATKGSAGYDISVAEDMILHPGHTYYIDTHIRFDGTEKVTFNGRPSDDWVFKIYPRSSMGKKYGMRFLNTTGIIDRDYRDNIILMTEVVSDCELDAGTRIAQGIICEYGIFTDETVPETERDGGIGSTGGN